VAGVEPRVGLVEQDDDRVAELGRCRVTVADVGGELARGVYPGACFRYVGVRR
jgi:hypothetical protein